jgi:hypothetical protein
MFFICTTLSFTEYSKYGDFYSYLNQDRKLNLVAQAIAPQYTGQSDETIPYGPDLLDLKLHVNTR